MYCQIRDKIFYILLEFVCILPTYDGSYVANQKLYMVKLYVASIAY